MHYQNHDTTSDTLCSNQDLMTRHHYYTVVPSVPVVIVIAAVVIVRGGAFKSLARPTSRCCRNESIVSLERGVCSCAESQVFSCYRGWTEAGQATHAISTTLRRELSSNFFISCKANHRRKFTPF